MPHIFFLKKQSNYNTSIDVYDTHSHRYTIICPNKTSIFMALMHLAAIGQGCHLRTFGAVVSGKALQQRPEQTKKQPQKQWEKKQIVQSILEFFSRQIRLFGGQVNFFLSPLPMSNSLRNVRCDPSVSCDRKDLRHWKLSRPKVVPSSGSWASMAASSRAKLW